MYKRVLVTAACVIAAAATMGQAKSPAADGFARLKTLQGDWIDVDGVFGEKGKVAVTYRVTGAGNTVVETFPVGTPYEMVTVYHLNGGRIVLTHYCTSNTQPTMTSPGLTGNAIAFEFSGGANIDPGKTSHMHDATIEFVSADEIKSTWVNWKGGKADHASTFRVVRKKSS
jgi:hypothetical protein